MNPFKNKQTKKKLLWILRNRTIVKVPLKCSSEPVNFPLKTLSKSTVVILLSFLNDEAGVDCV